MDSDWSRPIWEKTGMNEILGLPMSQNGFVVPFLSELATVARPHCIVEIGTGVAGLTYLLAGIADWVDTYDIERKPCLPSMILPDRVKRVEADVFRGEFSVEGGPIYNQVSRGGLCWILCDGGDKNREVETFAPFLKPGDIIAAHDYCPDRDTWRWHEIDEQRVENVAREQNLVTIPGLQYDQKAAWWVRMKT